MSTENKTPAGAPSLETSVASDRTTHFEQGQDKAVTQNDEGVSAEFDNGNVNVKTGLGDQEDGDEGEGSQEGQEGEGTQEQGEGGSGDEASELPEWDPANPDVEAQYDQRYFKEDGELDVTGVLSQEFWSNYRKDPDSFKDPSKGGLGEQTYAYLKDRLGLSKEAVIQVERGQLAIAQQAEQKFYNEVGGKARWEAAVAWGRENYSKPQQERFNAAMEKGGADAEDAVAALMGRYDQKFPRNGVRRGPPRRASTPQRDATKGAANGGGSASRDVFKSAAEYNTAIQEARKSGDQKLIDAVRAKGKRSNLK